MTAAELEVEADVVVIGAGAAGMYAALEARRLGADVVLVDKSLIGRGGATVMAQMTVAAALGHAEPDSPEIHCADTLAAGREIAVESLAEQLCNDGPRRIMETRDMGVDWAADGDRLRQVSAPGHSRARCCYVDVLATGQGLSRAMRYQIRQSGARVLPNCLVTDVIVDAEGSARGVVGLDAHEGEPVTIWAKAVVLASGGLTELYARTSSSANMTGDAFSLALRAGADLIEIEMVQFFPIASLAPRTIGLDPIMWDPFRYKLGGRLLNGRFEEFLHNYSEVPDEGVYRATRDVASYAILKEVEAGRGSPAGGAYLDFTGMPREAIHAAFPAAVDRLLHQGIDLTKQAVEVAPMAHYTIGGVHVDDDMRTSVPGLYAAGEAVGGAHGANRLSGNAITEALVFGATAGRTAAQHAAATTTTQASGNDLRRLDRHLRTRVTDRLEAPGKERVNLPAVRRRLKQVMWDHVGPFRDEPGLDMAQREIEELRRQVAGGGIGRSRRFNIEWVESLELEMMLETAEAVILAGRMRRESRGAHQRDDFPETDPALSGVASMTRMESSGLTHHWMGVGHS